MLNWISVVDLPTLFLSVHIKCQFYRPSNSWDHADGWIFLSLNTSTLFKDDMNFSKRVDMKISKKKISSLQNLLYKETK